MHIALIMLEKTEMHAAKSLWMERSSFESRIAIEKLKYINHQVLMKFLQNWT